MTRPRPEESNMKPETHILRKMKSRISHLYNFAPFLYKPPSKLGTWISVPIFWPMMALQGHPQSHSPRYGVNACVKPHLNVQIWGGGDGEEWRESTGVQRVNKNQICTEMSQGNLLLCMSIKLYRDCGKNIDLNLQFWFEIFIWFMS